MPEIKVEINCGSELCGPCHGLGWVALARGGEMTDPVCNIFNLDLGKAGPDDAHRCPECQAAEVKP